MKQLEDVLNPKWDKYYQEAIDINRKIVGFCLERELKPVFICVPLTKFLSSKIPDNVRKHLVTDFVNKCNENEVPFLDYSEDDEFSNPSYYFNSFFLNLRGRKEFTKRVLNDLNIK